MARAISQPLVKSPRLAPFGARQEPGLVGCAERPKMQPPPPAIATQAGKPLLPLPAGGVAGRALRRPKLPMRMSRHMTVTEHKVLSLCNLNFRVGERANLDLRSKRSVA